MKITPPPPIRTRNWDAKMIAERRGVTWRIVRGCSWVGRGEVGWDGIGGGEVDGVGSHTPAR